MRFTSRHPAPLFCTKLWQWLRLWTILCIYSINYCIIPVTVFCLLVRVQFHYIVFQRILYFDGRISSSYFSCLGRGERKCQTLTVKTPPRSYSCFSVGVGTPDNSLGNPQLRIGISLSVWWFDGLGLSS